MPICICVVLRRVRAAGNPVSRCWMFVGHCRRREPSRSKNSMFRLGVEISRELGEVREADPTKSMVMSRR